MYSAVMVFKLVASMFQTFIGLKYNFHPKNTRFILQCHVGVIRNLVTGKMKL